MATSSRLIAWWTVGGCLRSQTLVSMNSSRALMMMKKGILQNTEVSINHWSFARYSTLHRCITLNGLCYKACGQIFK